ncbi:helix-turn-helix domain-containing protein [Sansalvadorimonas verongulae]|uniref:YdaS family helix-turn-helix protein n=1 Tax=Sansalvadorimonas verongulae TaxID=2172824 RepID=UPI0012BC415A|nr:YdaS family helix-turn-helix protein [Sansalvadorimonas verongulae]MTI12365.1 hypothetical protein [Sansalvadorimonas verongulae]
MGRKKTTVQSVIDHFNTPTELAKALNLSVKNVYIWRRQGYISGPACDAIEEVTGGRFKAIELRKMAKSARGRSFYRK